MSKRHTYAECQRHKPFRTEGKAFAHLLEKLKNNEVDPGVTTFRCSYCRNFHIGGAGRVSLERVIRGE